MDSYPSVIGLIYTTQVAQLLFDTIAPARSRHFLLFFLPQKSTNQFVRSTFIFNCSSDCYIS